MFTFDSIDSVIIFKNIKNTTAHDILTTFVITGYIIASQFLEPFVAPYFIKRWSLARICLQNARNEILCILIDIVRNLVLCGQNLHLELIHVWILEW